MERRSHHADHLVAAAVQLNRSTDDRGIGAEAALPQRVAQDDDARRPLRFALLGLGEAAAQKRRHAERVAQARGNACRSQPLGLTRAGEVQRGDGPHHRQVLEHLLARPPVVVVGGAGDQPAFRVPRIARRQPDQAIGVEIRELAQEHAVDDREHCGRHRDADREDGDQRAGERRMMPEAAQHGRRITPRPTGADPFDEGVPERPPPRRAHDRATPAGWPSGERPRAPRRRTRRAAGR